MNEDHLHRHFPAVSIGLPTYNRPTGLRKALEWISKQTYPNIEVIISDNYSEIEEVQEITKEFSSKDTRIRVFRQEKNIGLENNFNFVYAQSKAPYFIWMSDDDFFEPNYVEECVAFLEKNPQYILCSGVAKYYEGDKYLFDETMFQVEGNRYISRIVHYFSHVEKNGNFYGVFRNINLFSDPPLPAQMGSDWSFMAKLTILGKLAYVSTTAYHRSIEGNSQTRKKIVTKYKLKGWKNIFFETYQAYIVSSNIFTDNYIRSKVPLPLQWCITFIVFLQINWKLFWKFIRKVIRKVFNKTNIQ